MDGLKFITHLPADEHSECFQLCASSDDDDNMHDLAHVITHTSLCLFASFLGLTLKGGLLGPRNEHLELD